MPRGGIRFLGEGFRDTNAYTPINQILHHYIKTKFIRNYPNEEISIIEEYVDETIFNLVTFGSSLSQWKQINVEIDSEWLQNAVITPYFNEHKENSIVKKAFFREFIKMLLDEMEKENFNGYHRFISFIPLSSRWNVQEELALFTEIVDKGNEMYEEYLKNPLVQNWMKNSFGTISEENQISLLKMRVSYLSEYYWKMVQN